MIKLKNIETYNKTKLEIILHNKSKLRITIITNKDNHIKR